MGFQDGEQGRDVGGNLLVEWGELRGFKNDFEGSGVIGRWSSQNAAVSAVNDAFGRGKSIDLGMTIPRQVFLGSAESWFKNMSGQFGADGEAVEAVAGIIGVEGHEAFKAESFDLFLEQTDLTMPTFFPKLAIEINAAPVETGAIFVASGIADGIDKEFIAATEFGIFVQDLEKLEGGMAACDFVSVNTGKNTDSDEPGTAIRSNEEKTWHHIAIAAEINGMERCVKEMGRSNRKLPGGLDQLLNGAANTQAGIGFVEGRVGKCNHVDGAYAGKRSARMREDAVEEVMRGACGMNPPG